MICIHILSLVLVTCCAVLPATKAQYGYMRLANENGSESVEVCTSYNSNYRIFTIGLDNYAWSDAYTFQDSYPDDGCTTSPLINYRGALVFVKRGNCTFDDKAGNMSMSNASGVVVVAEKLLTPMAKVNATVAIITHDSYVILKNLSEKLTSDMLRIFLYIPSAPRMFDPNTFVMWLLAVITLATGAWLQGAEERKITVPCTGTPGVSGHTIQPSEEVLAATQPVDVVVWTWVHVMGYVVMASVFIVLMYFFYDYLVYVVISCFCLASAFSMFDLTYSAFHNLTCFMRYRFPPNRLPLLRYRPPVLCILLFLASCTLSIVWAVYRNSWFSWIIQDILGVSFCVFCLKLIKLPNGAISILMLLLFFIYDIFFVFISPYITSNSESIMVAVATGGGAGSTSKEEIPLLFKLPKFIGMESMTCLMEDLPYSRLGFGDIILPGLHVGFCAVWDAKISTNTIKVHFYYISGVIGYGVGLILTFIALYLMKVGQPALLYLAPCCILATLCVAWYRGEVSAIMNDSIKEKSKAASHCSVQPSAVEPSCGVQDAVMSSDDTVDEHLSLLSAENNSGDGSF